MQKKMRKVRKMRKIIKAKKVFKKSMDFINAYIAVIIIGGTIALGFAMIGGIITLMIRDANEALVFGKLMFSILMGVCLGLSILFSFAIAVNNDNVSIKSILTGKSAI